MIRGIYTGASGMTSMQVKMDIIANNLSNVDQTGFKKDEVIFKNFPELLLHRSNDDGVGWTPMGSFDTTPIVGKLGTGVEVNEIHTRFSQGSLKNTNRDADFALNGDGWLVVQTNRGERLTRNGSFILNKEGYLVTSQGFPLIGEKGSPIKINQNNFIVKTNGEVWLNEEVGRNPENIVGKDQNTWKEPVLIDTIKVRTVDYPRHLLKEGNSFYTSTPESGDYRALSDQEFPEILQGFLETSNVKVVREMVDMIEIQRSYEMNQKAIQTHDSMLGKLINEVAR